jgi:hypothetical protein
VYDVEEADSFELQEPVVAGVPYLPLENSAHRAQLAHKVGPFRNGGEREALSVGLPGGEGGASSNATGVVTGTARVRERPLRKGETCLGERAGEVVSRVGDRSQAGGAFSLPPDHATGTP